MTAKKKITIILGPTASGKSGLAVELAEKFGGEIISADSMQIYRGMDIATAKPSTKERSRVPHHLIDIINPNEDYSAASFGMDAAKAADEILGRGKNVLVAGGTGLYIRALLGGIFKGPGRADNLREELRKEAEEKGATALYERLKKADPEAAANIHPNNITRVIRALEVFHSTGRPISELQREHGFKESRYEALKIGLKVERKKLYAAIDARVEQMIEDGLLAETKRLLASGFDSGLKSMSALGYKEMISHIEGGAALDEAVEKLKQNTRRYAKRQMTWFGKDLGIRWFDPDDKDGIMTVIQGFLKD